MVPRLTLLSLLLAVGCRAEPPAEERLERILASDRFEVWSEAVHGGPQSIRVEPAASGRAVSYWFGDARTMEPVPYTPGHDSLLRSFVAEGLAQDTDSAGFDGAAFEVRGGGEVIAFSTPRGRVGSLYLQIANLGR